ncbi:rhodanese [Halovivax asiaticus JCM 14624]|uniref:Rhodanese n=1 Tax=Halovivax asiaticus JCM 14624 TaxID=1227490 RepID=M0BG01_9EURY|nr:sulfurtransferase [Halovivax asiaticus]ELZ09228.1 rhodanese [Halovivax asiaticus JCM 14624]
MCRTAHPTDVLVSPDWLETRLDEVQRDDPALRLVEVDVDTDAYEEGHVPGAVGFNWRTQLRDQTRRDLRDPDELATMLGDHGISDDSTIVLYGDDANWFAAYAYWQLKYQGHDDVRLLDGGREYWQTKDYPVTDEVPDYTPVEYDIGGPRETIRAYREDVELGLDRDCSFVDVRSPKEYSGELIAPPDMTETARRGGHIPGAENVSWTDVTDDEGLFRSRDELESLYAEAGITGDETTITYCRIGERASVAWFALHELLGYEDTMNYDGSWTEWGNLVNAPIETGAAE